MNEKKVYQQLSLFDYLLILIPLILLGLGTFAVLAEFKITGGGGPLGGFPIISAMVFGCVVFSLIAFISAILLTSKMVFRIIVGLAALPLLWISFGNLMGLFSVLFSNI